VWGWKRGALAAAPAGPVNLASNSSDQRVVEVVIGAPVETTDLSWVSPMAVIIEDLDPALRSFRRNRWQTVRPSPLGSIRSQIRSGSLHGRCLPLMPSSAHSAENSLFREGNHQFLMSGCLQSAGMQGFAEIALVHQRQQKVIDKPAFAD